MVRKLILLCLTALLLIPNAAAREFDPDQTGSISVTLLEQQEQQPICGAELAVYQVADARLNDSGRLAYTWTGQFADCGAELDDPGLSVHLDAFTAERTLPCRTVTTDDSGYARLDDLAPGLYFVRQTGLVDGFAPCSSFLVTVPGQRGDDFVYQMEATPKTEVYKSTTLVIRKQWNTDEATPIADSITVRLLAGEQEVLTTVLSRENNWEAVFTDLPQRDDYRIEEVEIPEGFTATYIRQGAVFTVINTPSLPQTGLLLWPITLLVLAGLTFLTVGVLILRRRRMTHE